MPTQPLWNLGPAPVNFYEMLAGIGKTISHGNETEIERQQRERSLGIQQQHVDLQKRELDQKRDDARTMGEALIAASGQFAQAGAIAAPMAAAGGSARPTFANIEGSTPGRKGFDARAVQGLAMNDMDYLVGRGLAPHQAAALVGHATQESGLNPAAVGDGGTSAGLFQWHNERRDGLQQWALANKRDPNDRRTQLDYALVEAQTKEPRAWQALQASRTPEEATAAWMHFERPQGYTPENPTGGSGYGNRMAAANQYLAAYTGRSGGSPAATPIQPAPGVPAPTRAAPVVVAENEDEVRAAEAGMMPGRPADAPAPGAVPAQYNVPPAPGASRVDAGASAGVPAAAMSSPAAPAPAAVLSQGLRGAAQAGMAPRDLALVRAMAMNPALQGHAAQILAKYAGPQERTPLQRFTGRDGNEYAFDPASGRVEPVAQYGDRGARPMTAEERATYSVPDGTGAYFDEKGQPHTLQGTAQTKIETNVGGSKAETEYDKKVGEAYGTTFNEMQAAGRNAAAVKNSLNLMETLTKNPNFYSGAGQEYVQGAKRALAAIGVEAAGNQPNEVFDALSKKLTLDVLGGKLGAGISNTDVSFITSTSPNLTATPEGNRALIEMHRKVQDRQVEVAQRARAYAKGNNGRLDAGFDDELARFSQENPIFRPEDQERVAKLAGGAAAPKPAPRVAPGVFTPEQIAAERKRRGL